MPTLLPPLLERHQRAIDLIRRAPKSKQGTIYFDITDHPSRDTTSSSRTTCILKPLTLSVCRSPASARRSPSAPIPGPKPRPRRWSTWRRSASAMAAAATPASAQSPFRPTAKTTPAPRPRLSLSSALPILHSNLTSKGVRSGVDYRESRVPCNCSGSQTAGSSPALRSGHRP